MTAISSCAFPFIPGSSSERWGTEPTSLKPEKNVELEILPLDFTDEDQKHGNFSREKVLEQFKNLPDTTLFQGSFLEMNRDSLAPAGKNNPLMKWTTHGNWCGKIPPSTGGRSRPVDDLDKACQAHQLCYRERWDRNCSCDDRLLKTVQDLKEGPPEIKKSLMDYFSQSRCVFKCRYLIKWKDAYIFRQGENRVPANLKKQFDFLTWNLGKLKKKSPKYISTSREYNYICLEEENLFQEFMKCAKGRPGNLYRLQCLEGTPVKKGIVVKMDWEAEGPRDTSILNEWEIGGSPNP